MRWLEHKPPCENCRLIYKNKGEDPPCVTCFTPLYEENRKAFKVFMATRHQVLDVPIPGTKNKVNRILDINAIRSAMEIFGVVDKETCYNKVMKAYQELWAEGDNPASEMKTAAGQPYQFLNGEGGK